MGRGASACAGIIRVRACPLPSNSDLTALGQTCGLGPVTWALERGEGRDGEGGCSLLWLSHMPDGRGVESRGRGLGLEGLAGGAHSHK